MPQLKASLPMYNLPEMAAAHAAFWDALAEELRADGMEGLPAALDFPRPAVPDRIGPETLFSQICGYPLQTIYGGQYELLGVPSYDAPGCTGFRHRAFILVRDDSPFQTLTDLRSGVFAMNSRHSNSGMNLPRMLFAPLVGSRPFFRAVVETGTHPASMAQVAAGEADAASVDCLTFAFFRDHRPAAVARLRVLAETPDSPAIPFVTSRATPHGHVAALRRALLRLAADPARKGVLGALRIRSIALADPTAYHRILDYERDAVRLGYPELA